MAPIFGISWLGPAINRPFPVTNCRTNRESPSNANFEQNRNLLSKTADWKSERAPLGANLKISNRHRGKVAGEAKRAEPQSSISPYPPISPSIAAAILSACALIRVSSGPSISNRIFGSVQSTAAAPAPSPPAPSPPHSSAAPPASTPPAAACSAPAHSVAPAILPQAPLQLTQRLPRLHHDPQNLPTPK